MCPKVPNRPEIIPIIGAFGVKRFVSLQNHVRQADGTENLGCTRQRVVLLMGSVGDSSIALHGDVD